MLAADVERSEAEPPLPAEIAFLESYGAPRHALARAAAVARRLGVEPEAALLGEGIVSEEFFYSALARRLGVPYASGEVALSPNTASDHALVAGMAMLADPSAGPRAILAPRGSSLRYLLDAAAKGEPVPPVMIASRQRLSAMVRAQFGAPVAREAAETLRATDPSLSASGGLSRRQIVGGLALGLALCLGAAFAPQIARSLVYCALWIVFAGAIALRSAAAVGADAAPLPPPLEDAELPLYTVVVALHREAAVVGKLTRAFDHFDYPHAKLDIKIVIERGDHETLTALAALRLPPRYDVIVAPPGRPLTKPRALNMALSVARGEYLVVFDAEDEPDRNQLRLAAERFAADPAVDALQARLTIANAADGWLTRMFAIEYAALFDIVNPGLAALDLPIALGGTSNHFRIRVLRRVGGWDAWNVTEDADLGIRLARFGARVGALSSDTAEEAPNELGNWFRQRVRWQKGWMQTLIVHTRRPLRLVRELGPRNAACALLLVGGTVITGLFGPLLLFDALLRGLFELFDPAPVSRFADVVTYILTLIGAQTIIIPAAVAMRRRGMPRKGFALVTMPAYYGLVFLATWVALIELARRPFHWHKTEHGKSGVRVAAKLP